ncbi:MAG TPA: site-2 protease family protein [Nitrososphaera sp.]|nr:site-2 protease family protein [Nitrososphaera sp.]
MASAFLNGGYSRAVPIVSSFFTVKDLQLNIREDYVEFLVAEAEVKDKFPSLLNELRKIGMIAMAKRSKFFWKLMPTLSSAIRLQIPESVVISVFKLQKQKPKNKYRQAIPALLFIATVLIVFVDGIFRSDSPLVRAHVQDPMLLAGIYTISLMGILGIHELGHLLANWKHKIKASWPYFIPAYPGGLTPTFGALIVLRSSMTNRNVMFDVGIAGPIAGLIVTIMVSIYGSTISTLITAEEAQQLTENGQLGQLFIGESALMIATVHLTGMAVENMVLVISPVLYAAWLGFLITFLNLLPAWQLDGGHLARSALGVRWHKILTYASVAILFALPLYIMAIIVLFFSSRTPANVPLDDVTPLTSKRKMLFFVALGLAVLCAPIPTTLFGLISFGP